MSRTAAQVYSAVAPPANARARRQEAPPIAASAPPPSDRSAPRSALRSGLLALATLALGAALAAAGAEILLRATGRGPWRPLAPPANEPALYEPHPERGWRPRAGDFVYPGYRPGSEPLQLSVDAEGARATGPAPAEGSTVDLVGCSFAQGWAVSDAEALGYQLQARWPGRRVRNLAVGGYGTYQALLLLEERFASRSPPDAVLYGFADVHEERNVAAPRWLRSLALASRSGMAAAPYATLDAEGRLVRHPPARYPRWPGREASALVTFLQDLAARRAGAGRAAQARAVTRRLVLEMHDLALRHGARFAVALLVAEPATRRDTLAFLRGHGIETADCAFPIPLSHRVHGDGHPNGTHHALWADCVARRFPAGPDGD